MKHQIVRIAIIAALVGLTGCVVVPAKTAANTCRMLDIALDEADMAAAWYVNAGEVLEKCGARDARERAEFRACMKERRDDDTSICHDM
ncbi:hypothetical protein [Diaphorobacter caeni]|uniref:hypothetical protein n=1 Tax=Diaphorobacter caeni TaxID=2784387 RepID=UPI00188FC9C4|nr:hypothetical protein [Diaphorobacter caeni]MBF5003360.1 hypothetical protein [Diaphorobacter caeni]